MTALAHHQPTQMQLNQDNPIAAMLQAITEKGITAETANALEKLTDLYLKVDAENAKRAFAVAKSQLQAELPRINASKKIPGNDGTIRSRFADFDSDIMPELQPYLTKHGFSVGFDMRAEDGRMVGICKLKHSQGHSESNEFSVRVSKVPGTSDAQSDVAARSYARRIALCDCLNLTFNRSDDARLEGGFISPDEVEALRARIVAGKHDLKQFLTIAGCDSLETIRTGKLEVLENLLDAKERKVGTTGRPSPIPSPQSGGGAPTAPAALAKCPVCGATTNAGQACSNCGERDTVDHAWAHEAPMDAVDAFLMPLVTNPAMRPLLKAAGKAAKVHEGQSVLDLQDEQKRELAYQTKRMLRRGK